jgi:site-specific recombinase XerD
MPWRYKRAKGPVVPVKAFHERFSSLAKTAGLSPWLVNVLRHSFASYRLAKYEDEATLKHLMGHHLSSDVLRKHYLNLVTPEVAQKYWEKNP